MLLCSNRKKIYIYLYKNRFEPLRSLGETGGVAKLLKERNHTAKRRKKNHAYIDNHTIISILHRY